jgi:geranylgeranyl diphosphate synthase type II
MHEVKYLQQLVEDQLNAMELSNRPSELYDPIRYMLKLGGKRIRPVLLLMSHQLFREDFDTAMGPALGIEVFHNFTLLHDDIMDKAPLRRNQPTVHSKWNQDIAILSGDTMFVKACQLMMQTESEKMKLVLCEGQQLDMNFETQSSVSIEDYVEMITLKTAVLLGCSLKIGAITGGASLQDAERLYHFGKDLGIAFQLHDDVLDAYGDPLKFGKQVGGDIIANKKTFLLLNAMKLAKGETADELNHWLTVKEFDPAEKVNAVKNIFDRLGVKGLSEQALENYFQNALKALEEIPVEASRKSSLLSLAKGLMVRES